MRCRGDEAIKAISLLSEWAIPAATTPPDVHFTASASVSPSLAVSPSPAAAATDEAEVDPHDLAPTWGTFNVAFDTKLGYFPWLERPENKARLSQFGRGMTGARLWEVAENIIGGTHATIPITI